MQSSGRALLAQLTLQPRRCPYRRLQQDVHALVPPHVAKAEHGEAVALRVSIVTINFVISNGRRYIRRPAWLPALCQQ